MSLDGLKTDACNHSLSLHHGAGAIIPPSAAAVSLYNPARAAATLHSEGAEALPKLPVQPSCSAGLSVAAALGRLRSARSAATPTAMVGFKEWIFSHKSGALGTFAAASEYVFASVLQRDMAIGNVRLHYGHPDVFDRLHCMTKVRRGAAPPRLESLT